MIVNTALLVLYVYLLRGRDSFVALLAFVLSWSVFINTTEPHFHHLATAAVYCLCIFARSIRLMALMALVAIHQYIMAIDALLFPSTETILYGLYPYIAITLNLLILATIKRLNHEAGSASDNHHIIHGRTWSNH